MICFAIAFNMFIIALVLVRTLIIALGRVLALGILDVCADDVRGDDEPSMCLRFRDDVVDVHASLA